jgi:hypothetical protein
MLTMRKAFRTFLDAYLHFDAQDGWALASHVALSTLTSGDEDDRLEVAQANSFA